MLSTRLGVYGATSGTGGSFGLPANSIHFTAAMSYLSMADGDFALPNADKFALSTWIDRESASDTFDLFSFASAGYLRISATGAFTLSDGNAGLRTSTTGLTDTASWHHILAYYDNANGTEALRVRVWLDGAELAFTGTTPTSAQNFGGSIRVGNRSTADTAKLYQWAFFYNSLPDIADVYNAGDPVNIAEVAGLYSTLSALSGDVNKDGLLAANWTAVGTVQATSQRPS